jgi:hypothetical protein
VFCRAEVDENSHLKRLNIHNLDQQQIAGLCAFDLKRARKIVNLGQVYISDIVCTVVVADLPTGPANCEFPSNPVY